MKMTSPHPIWPPEACPDSARPAAAASVRTQPQSSVQVGDRVSRVST